MALYQRIAGQLVQLTFPDGGYKGDWQAGAQYNAGDFVRHAGSTWGAYTTPAVGAEPGVAADWHLFRIYRAPYVPTLSVPGWLSTGQTTNPWYNDSALPVEIEAIRPVVATAPLGADIDINYLVGGAAMYSFSITAGTYSPGKLEPSITVPAGQTVAIEITQVGSTTPGADLSIAHVTV